MILGKKKEMTQIFLDSGAVVPCTIIDVSGVAVVGKRTKERDGYEAIILGMGRKRRAKKVEEGVYKDLKFVPKVVSEFRISKDTDSEGLKIGEDVKIENFKTGEKVDISGVTKGKGFQGVVRRWGFKGGSRTRGQSDKQRHGGSIGAGTDPGRVFKGKKMPGRMGGEVMTIRNLEIVKVDTENALLCVKGAVPGGRHSVLRITKA